MSEGIHKIKKQADGVYRCSQLVKSLENFLGFSTLFMHDQNIYANVLYKFGNAKQKFVQNYFDIEWKTFGANITKSMIMDDLSRILLKFEFLVWYYILNNR